MTQHITLPLGPSSNRYWRHSDGRTYVSEEASAYRTEAGWLAKAAGVECTDQAVAVRLDIYRARKSGDLDNFLKVVLDALRGVAYTDDRQVVKIEARRFDDALNPRVEVWIEAVEVG